MEKLLNSLLDKFFEEKTYAYSNNVKAFFDFLEHKKISSENLLTFLQGIRTENIIESLEFYIQKNDIGSKDTAHRYSSALKEFFYFILDSEKVVNSELMRELQTPSYKEDSYRYKINNFISNHKELKDREGFEYLSEDTINELISQCNVLLSSEEDFNKAKIKKKYFNKFRSAIIIKLILLSGAAYRTLCGIKRADLCIDDLSININSYTITLPKAFRSNIRDYLKLAEEINPIAKELFIEFNGESMSTKTSTTSEFLKNIIGRSDLTGIIKYTITNMIKEGISEKIIKEVTGIQHDIYNDCHERVFDNVRSKRHFESKIRGIAIYDRL